MKAIVINIFYSLVLIAAIVLTPLVSSADLADYSLAGTVREGADSTAIWGNLTAENSPTLWNSVGIPGTSTWYPLYAFRIMSFSIYSKEFTYTGFPGSGQLYFVTDSTRGWHLWGTMNWDGGTKTGSWDGTNFYNLNKDGTYNLDLSTYNKLSPTFAMDGLFYAFLPWSDEGRDQWGSTIVASLQEASVPEPSTFLQMLCGLVLLSLAGRRAGIRVN